MEEKEMKPSDKLMKAIFGKLPEEMTAEERERWKDKILEIQASSFAVKEFEKVVGETPSAYVNDMMLFTGWCEALAKWRLENYYAKKYHVGDFQPMFSFKQVVDIAQHFYNQGHKDGEAGVSEYDRLWKLNKEEKNDDKE